MKQNQSPGESFWFRILSALYAGIGFYLWYYVHALMLRAYPISEEIGISPSPLQDNLLGFFKKLFTVSLDEKSFIITGIDITPVFFFGIVVFFGILLLPDISKLIGKKHNSENHPSRTGFLGVVITFLCFVLVTLSPKLDYGSVFLLIIVVLFWSLLLYLFNLPFYPRNLV